MPEKHDTYLLEASDQRSVTVGCRTPGCEFGCTYVVSEKEPLGTLLRMARLNVAIHARTGS